MKPNETLSAADTLDAMPEAASRLTTIAGRYEILGMLGEGGMGAVYKARDRELDELVALKMLRRELASAPGALDRFRREVKLARRISHPNVVRTFDLGESDTERFITMELVDGESLATAISARGAMPLARVREIGLALCAGIQAAHGAGVLHRDLKPDNVLLSNAGRIVITDFGIARPTGDPAGTASAIGTPAYMAPEQITSPNVDERADIYALGTILFELSTGKRAWPGDEPIGVALARLTAPPPDPRAISPLPPRFAELVVRCLCRDPEGRPPSAAAVADALATLELDQRGTETAARIGTGSSPLSTASSVAVLPFRNMGDADAHYIADAFTEEIVDALSMTRGLRVRPLAGVRAASSAGQDPAEIGRRLGVNVVVEGSVRRMDDRLRIHARLIGVADGFQVWAQRSDCKSEEALVTADTISRSIAEALAVRLDDAGRRPTSPEVIDLYLRAKAAVREGWYTGKSVDDLSLLERGLSLAPEDPGLLAQYAAALARRSFFAREPDEALRERARRAAERAVEVAPRLGDSWYALATVRWNAGEVAGSMAAMKRAVEHAPSLARGHEQIAAALFESDRVTDAITRYRTALAIDPSDGARLELARCYAMLGDWARYDAESMRVSGDLPALRRVWVPLRMRLWRDAPKPLEPPSLSAFGADVRPLLDATARAEHGVRLLPETATLLRDSAMAIPNPRLRCARLQFTSEVFGYTGDVDGVVALAQAAVRAGLYDVCWLRRCPVLAEARQHPAWPELESTVASRAAEVLASLDA